MKTIRLAAIVLTLGVMSVALCACSRSSDETSAPVSASPAGKPAEAAAPAPVAAPAPATEAPLAPEFAARLVRFHSPVLGRTDAPVTITEFLDPACEACRAFAPVVKQILFVHPDDVRVVVRFVAFHHGSDEAIRVLEAARKQGKFDEVLTALFDRQEEWASHAAPNPQKVWQIAGDSGLTLSKGRTDARAASTDALLKQETEDRVALKVERTPTFFVNGRPLTQFGPQPLFDAVAAEIQRTRESGKPAR